MQAAGSQHKGRTPTVNGIDLVVSDFQQRPKAIFYPSPEDDENEECKTYYGYVAEDNPDTNRSRMVKAVDDKWYIIMTGFCTHVADSTPYIGVPSVGWRGFPEGATRENVYVVSKEEFIRNNNGVVPPEFRALRRQPMHATIPTAQEKHPHLGDKFMAWERAGLHHLAKKVLCEPQPFDGVKPTTLQPFEIQVVLERDSLEQKYGIVYQVTQDKRIIITAIKDSGVCFQYNAGMRRFPPDSPLYSHQVLPDDEILVVNGEREADNVKQELLSANLVHIRILRHLHPHTAL